MVCVYWPSKGAEEFNALIHSGLPGGVQFGIVQFFIEHTITLTEKSAYLLSSNGYNITHINFGMVSLQQFAS